MFQLNLVEFEGNMKELGLWQRRISICRERETHSRSSDENLGRRSCYRHCQYTTLVAYGVVASCEPSASHLSGEGAFWVQHEGMQIFSIDVQLGGLRFPIGGGDHKMFRIKGNWLLVGPLHSSN
ncbi:uncharacterized protein LOC118487328 isoform X1 [Helianthus annuus]|uniref:uncharacterized protein LOC118487328 isoform X1 n=1 Tax=Helianthus annuus TaxID=4232 RepID=UPI001653367A|nr:uncharacterized protein LOC118487328 isoform X1 [Helianthus annuus]